MKKIIGKFAVEHVQILDENGKADARLMPRLSADQMLKMYEYMVITRVFDDKAFKLQRQGRLGTYAQSLGQEAAAVGSAFAAAEEDWIFPSFREHGAFMVKKYPLGLYFQFWSGDERGSHVPAGTNIFTIAIPVSTHIPHGVGFAWAMKIRKKKAATLIYFGDGATSKGDFHEALNFAGVFKVPAVFICQNNQWAISVPVRKQTLAKTIAQKAVAYGFSGVRVDGNDVFAVYKAAKEAIDRAHAGGGPTLIECLTYRMADHTTSDDAKRYRKDEEVEMWKKRDPIERLEKYLMTKKILMKEKKEKIWADAAEKVDQAVKEFEDMPPPNPEDMFSHVYAKMPAELEQQLEEFRQAPKEIKKQSQEKTDKDVVAK